MQVAADTKQMPTPQKVGRPGAPSNSQRSGAPWWRRVGRPSNGGIHGPAPEQANHGANWLTPQGVLIVVALNLP
jgi:hypothetical protein